MWRRSRTSIRNGNLGQLPFAQSRNANRKKRAHYDLLLAGVTLTLLSCALPAATIAPDDLPLDVYQKIKGDFDALYGASSTLISGLQARSRQEVEADLRADTTANKDVLIRSLHSPAALKRELSVMALEYCGDRKTAVAVLQPLLTRDADPSVRRACAEVLAHLPDATAADALLRALNDSEASVRGISATALGNIRDNRATDGLLRVLNDDNNPMVRLQAAMALSKIKDESALTRMKKALDAETDERVKMAIAGALRATMGGDDAKTTPIPTPDQTASELTDLAREMKDVETKLREDRYDQSVQSQGKGIEDHLSSLIVKLDKICGTSSTRKTGDKRAKQPRQSGQQAGAKRASSPMRDSRLGGIVPPGPAGPAVAGFVSGTQDKWAKLPPAERGELLQAFREEVPEHWKKRLEAYFTSIAAEEAYGK